MATVGLIAALPQEIKPFLRRVGGWERLALDRFLAYRFSLICGECLVLQSGMGLGPATDAAGALVAGAGPQLLVSFGVAGALCDDLCVGDVVLAGSACLLDREVPCGCQPLAAWSEAAQQAAAGALLPRHARLVQGTTITTSGSQAVRLGSRRLAHPVLEMETAGIARLAARHGIPLLAIRAVSDTPAQPLPSAMAELLDGEPYLRPGRLIRAVLRHPQALPQWLRLARNMDRATANLAVALVAALGVPLLTT